VQKHSTFHQCKINIDSILLKKPVALYKWLLKNYAKQGDKILDTHVGSASSLIACYQMNFDFIGFEIDKDYYEKALKRMADEMAQISIFKL
jgi:site-specific DNA-methyltransferase (adenine-specific)